METIITYLDNIFAGLPKTEPVRRLKAELLANMEDKYRELKADGISEGEAIRVVISEFGSIDELLESMDILQKKAESSKDTESDEMVSIISRAEAYDFLDVKRRSGLLIALGVFLCIGAPAVFMLVSGDFNGGVSQFRENIGLLPFFIMVAAAVGMFILSSFMIKPYEYLKSSAFILEYGLEDTITEHRASYQITYVTTLVIGVLLCVLSPLPVIIMGGTGNSFLDNFGVTALLFMVASAVFMFVYFGEIKSSYEILLQKGQAEGCDEYEKREKPQSETKEDKVIKAVSAVVWPMVLCIYLGWSFLFGAWGISWIIFPITGILFSAFTNAYKAMK